MKELEKINEHEAHHVKSHDSSSPTENKHEIPSEHHSFAKYC